MLIVSYLFKIEIEKSKGMGASLSGDAMIHKGKQYKRRGFVSVKKQIRLHAFYGIRAKKVWLEFLCAVYFSFAILKNEKPHVLQKVFLAWV